jgi:hypothetical protein
MDEQAKINKDAVTKFKAMEKILENLDDKVTEVGSVDAKSAPYVKHTASRTS